MNSIEIKSAKIKNDNFLDYSYKEKKTIKTDDVGCSSDLPFHSDCRQAFLNLLPHLILICEQEKANKKMKDFIYEGVEDPHDEVLMNYEVTAFKIGGSGDGEGVTLTGKRFLSTGKTLNLNTPFLRFDDEDYKFTNELVETLEVLKSEVYQYMTGAKHAPIAQQSMEFGDEAFDGEDDITAQAQKHLQNIKENVVMNVISHGNQKD